MSLPARSATCWERIPSTSPSRRGSSAPRGLAERSGLRGFETGVKCGEKGGAKGRAPLAMGDPRRSAEVECSLHPSAARLAAWRILALAASLHRLRVWNLEAVGRQPKRHVPGGRSLSSRLFRRSLAKDCDSRRRAELHSKTLSHGCPSLSTPNRVAVQ